MPLSEYQILLSMFVSLRELEQTYTSGWHFSKNTMAFLSLQNPLLSRHPRFTCIPIAATFGTEYMHGAFPLVWQNYDIQVLELFPIFLLVQVFASTLANKFVVFHCDNLPIVSILNKPTSKNSKVMKLLRPMILSLLKYNVKFRATHIPGCSNILCDRLSRIQITDKLLRDYEMNLHPKPIPPSLHPLHFALQ